jgi:hypothetical protein
LMSKAVGVLRIAPTLEADPALEERKELTLLMDSLRWID